VLLFLLFYNNYFKLEHFVLHRQTLMKMMMMMMIHWFWAMMVNERKKWL